MTSLLLPARISAGDAVRLFGRRRFTNLYGLWPSRPVKCSPEGQPASLERLWMPAYAFRLSLARGRLRNSIWVSVDASFGGFALFERVSILEEALPEEECLPVVIESDEAEKRARQGLLRFMLRKRGAKALIEGTEEMRPYYAPVWVYYFYRSGRKIDLAVLDGYSGSPMGGQMRAAIISAFVQKRKHTAAEA